MFTGLVEDVGTLETSAGRDDGGRAMWIRPRAIATTELCEGESIAVDGACLTVSAIEHGAFEVVAGNETLRRTTLGEASAGAGLNLERALKMGDRLGGHMVSGHVDAVAEIASQRDLGANLELSFKPPPEMLRYVVEKGSISVDGISLTVNRVTSRSFSVALIPHTVSHTGLSGKAVGAKVNVEVDMIGKYVERLLGGYLGSGGGAGKGDGR